MRQRAFDLRLVGHERLPAIQTIVKQNAVVG
jgi:hypothetical protein